MVKKSDVITLGLDAATGQAFTLPVRGAATKTLGVFGKKNSGKTWTAAVWVEQLLTHKIPVAILDPVGRWWDLGLSADGQGPGFPVAILGGKRGQVALTADMGAAIARYVAQHHVPTVVDLSFESKGTWRRLVADFCDELFRINELPVHLVIEEAPEFIPQRVMSDQGVVYAAVDRIVRLGRNHGIGVTAIGQRLQTTNKDTVSQVDALVVMRLIDPQGKKAALEWVKAKGQEEHAEAFVEALATLPAGTGYVWSPEWLEVFARVRFAARTTFHYDPDLAAEAAPTGEVARAVDTEELQREFLKFRAGAKLDEAKKSRGMSEAGAARQVTELKRQVESLTAALESAQAQAATEDEIQHRVDVAVQTATVEMRSRQAQLEAYVSSVVKQGQALFDGAMMVAPSVIAQGLAAPQKIAEYVAKQTAFYNSRTVTKIMDTLADNYLRFPQGMNAEEIGTEAGYDPYGGRFQGTLRKLVKRRVLVKDGERYLLNPAHLR